METFTKDSNQAEITYKLKNIFCHDSGCWVCAQGKGHGPYWYASYRIGDKIQTIFLGKEFKPLHFKGKSAGLKQRHQNSGTSSHQGQTINSAENRFHTQPPKSVIPAKTKITAQANTPEKRARKPLPPTRFDFERDLRLLKNTLRAENLKSVYRKLTKKYHPDKYPGIDHINTWMAEINGQYSQMKKTLRL